MKVINVAGKQLIVMGKGIKDLPLSPSKKNPAVMRHQGGDGQTCGIHYAHGLGGDHSCGRKKGHSGPHQPSDEEYQQGFARKSIRLVIVLRKGQAGEHPFSESQRRWAWAAEDKGELEPGAAHKWSKRVEGKKLPKHTEDGEAVHAQD